MTWEFRCEDAGVSCAHVTKADEEDELLSQVAEHARTRHGVELTQTLKDYAASAARRSES